jgi:multidrug efflux pump
MTGKAPVPVPITSRRHSRVSPPRLKADGESRRALGLIIVGGLVVSQFITLYITPVIFLYLEKLRRHGADDHNPGLDVDQSSPVLPNG